MERIYLGVCLERPLPVGIHAVLQSDCLGQSESSVLWLLQYWVDGNSRFLIWVLLPFLSMVCVPNKSSEEKSSFRLLFLQTIRTFCLLAILTSSSPLSCLSLCSLLSLSACPSSPKCYLQPKVEDDPTLDNLFDTFKFIPSLLASGLSLAEADDAAGVKKPNIFNADK